MLSKVWLVYCVWMYKSYSNCLSFPHFPAQQSGERERRRERERAKDKGEEDSEGHKEKKTKKTRGDYTKSVNKKNGISFFLLNLITAKPESSN